MQKSSSIRLAIHHYLYGVWFISIFVLTALITAILITVVPGQHNRRGITHKGARALFRLTGAWPKIEGLEHLPATAAVVVANHASYLDGMLLAAVLPQRYQFVIKREVASIPGVHFYLRRVGAHFVERFDARKGANDARRIMQTGKNGGSLVFFPEGTFRYEPGLRRFQNGAFTIATRQQLPLVPLTIVGTRAMLPAHTWLPRPGQIEVTLHAPVPTAAGTHPMQVRDTCRAIILNSLPEPDLQNSTD